MRNIPAHAGKTDHRFSECSRWAEHPRARGENFGFFVEIIISEGTSPRTRGKPQAVQLAQLTGRNIPAHAGKTAAFAQVAEPGWEHPRARGENFSTIAEVAGQTGTSPRTRGKRPKCQKLSATRGNIPAHAGKTGADVWAGSSGEEHPRARGENSPHTCDSRRPAGTSPRTRGKRHGDFGKIQGIRNIPAHAGKTQLVNQSTPGHTEHPRARGENRRPRKKPRPPRGTSPRTRGKHFNAHDFHVSFRNIPAHAGKTRIWICLRTTESEHPRARGENGPERP